MIMASGVFAFTIGSIGSLISKSNAVENEYREQVIAVNRYMKRKKLPSDLQFRVRRYLDYIWENKKKNRLDEKQILILLSEPLRDEIYSHIHGLVIKFCKIFDKFESNFISQLARTLINETFAPEDVIIEEGEMTNKMYFIMNGKVVVYHSFTKSKFADLKEKDYFGEISFFTEKPRTASVKCIDFLDVLSLTRLNFNSLIQKFPEASEINERLIKSCEKGDFSSLLVKCFICEELGHYAIKCKEILINLDQEITRDKWLKYKNIQEAKFINFSSNLNPNYIRKNRSVKPIHYNSRNVVGVPRTTLKITKNCEMFPVVNTENNEHEVMESSTGESADHALTINIRPIYSDNDFDNCDKRYTENYEEPKEKNKRSYLVKKNNGERKSREQNSKRAFSLFSREIRHK